jgi:rfaE bifunctional protein kinase chain/domain
MSIYAYDFRELKEKLDALGSHKLVFVHGLFNILHPGHLRLLRFAKECGDVLIVAVMADKFNTQSEKVDEQARLDFVSAIDWVDYAFIAYEEPEYLIRELKPHVVVKGKEHQRKLNPEESAVNDVGAKLIFSSGPSYFSSSELIRTTREKTSIDCLSRPDYFDRHELSEPRLIEICNRFSSLKVCVFGDSIVDEYINCDPLGMSQEDPTIVVTPVDEHKFVGGAAIVSGHAKALGAGEVHYFSVVGDDEIAIYLEKSLNEYEVSHVLFRDDSRPTTLKTRYRSRNKTLLRVNRLRDHDISRLIQQSILHKFKEKVERADVVIFSDFNYGVLTQDLVDEITKLCLNNNIMMVADSQCSSQTGDISRFNNMTFVSPTEHEARLSLRNKEDGLVVLAEELRQKINGKHVFITLGEEGVFIHSRRESDGKVMTDRLPAFNSNATDNAGAGDCFMTASAMAMAAGANLWEAAYLGSIAAAVQVGRVGNLPLTNDELVRALRSHLMAGYE